MSTLPIVLLRVTGGFAVLFSAIGLCSTAISLTLQVWAASTSGELARELLNDAPHFYPAYYTMSSISIVCCVLLAIFGIQFLRGNPNRAMGFTYLMIFEIAYWLSIILTSLVADFGMSVAAAAGVANGGVLNQFFILFPLWAPIIALRNRKILRDLVLQSQAELGEGGRASPFTS